MSPAVIRESDLVAHGPVLESELAALDVIPRGAPPWLDTEQTALRRVARGGGPAELLTDLPRTGRTARITCRERAVVLTIACQRPQEFGRCEGRMTQQIIAEDATRTRSERTVIIHSVPIRKGLDPAWQLRSR